MKAREYPACPCCRRGHMIYGDMDDMLADISDPKSDTICLSCLHPAWQHEEPDELTFDRGW